MAVRRKKETRIEVGAISRKKLNQVEKATAAYYDSLTNAERRDDAAWAATASKSARKLQID